MGFFRTLFLPYLRLRHAKGYGVHSPFAFSIIEGIINPGYPKYGYYAYKDIAKEALRCKSGAKAEEFARFLYRMLVNLPVKRLICNFQPDRPSMVAIDKGRINLFHIVHELNLRFMEPGTLLIVKNRGYYPEYSPLSKSLLDEGIKRVIDTGIMLLLSGETDEIREFLEKTRHNGVLFYDKHTLLYLPREEMAFVSYECKLS